MDYTLSDELLLALSMGGQLLLCGVLLRSRLYRVFPIFFLCILYSTVSDIGFLLLYRYVAERTYFLAYLANNVPEFLLEVGILVEVAFNVLNPVKRSLPRPAVYLFLGMIVLATLAALLLSMHSVPDHLDRWPRYFVRMNLAVAILRLTLFAAIASFSQWLGIGWKNHVFQIATGFLGYSVVVLLVEMLHHFTGVATNPTLYHLHDQLRIIGWCMVLGYWSHTLSRSEAPRKEFSPQMADFLVSLSQVSRNSPNTAGRWYRK